MRNPILIITLTALGLMACGKQDEAPPVSPAPEVAAVTTPAQAEAAPSAAPAPAPESATPAAATDASAAPNKYRTSCASCHGANGQGVGTFPRLTGQSADDVQGKLMSYKSKTQVGAQSALMYPLAGALSDAEIAALAAHIATLTE
ncbi:MAG: c-type cytochrome [Thiotrichales bacterium]